jgi:hypothetical protein
VVFESLVTMASMTERPGSPSRAILCFLYVSQLSRLYLLTRWGRFWYWKGRLLSHFFFKYHA